ncbi:manganese efflux pump MntP family protein [Paenibacillus pinistramenti]|uniref:manganese efflux pump MntP n=1 Tax=Paenibacillus pinistramenti TaxID=1768003 RepID=UPI001107F024|nr:manganese efflux pump MntP family protein [Paenibacillus pinistramenti]
MNDATAQLGQIVTIIVMAVALGMDAFSLSVGIGMKGVRRLDMARISGLIGVFHIFMPLLGIFTGLYVGHLLGAIAGYVSGGLLALLGGHMVWASFRNDGAKPIDHTKLLRVALFSLSVSVDSFSVGVSLGMFHSNLLFTVLTFGLFGGLMSLIGLWLGSRVGRSLGDYGEALGGAILLAFGLMFIF